MIPDTAYQTLWIEMYVREDVRGAADRIDDVIDRLERSTEDGAIESLGVESWENSTGSPAHPAICSSRARSSSGGSRSASTR